MPLLGVGSGWSPVELTQYVVGTQRSSSLSTDSKTCGRVRFQFWFLCCFLPNQQLSQVCKASLKNDIRIPFVQELWRVQEAFPSSKLGAWGRYESHNQARTVISL